VFRQIVLDGFRDFRPQFVKFLSSEHDRPSQCVALITRGRRVGGQRFQKLIVSLGCNVVSRIPV
jgi:hypothetical protein